MNLYLSLKEYRVKRKRIVENIKKHTQMCAKATYKNWWLMIGEKQQSKKK